jgi:hypothetical protein
MGAQKKIAVISEDLAEPWDEGIKKFAYSIARAAPGGRTPNASAVHALS